MFTAAGVVYIGSQCSVLYLQLTCKFQLFSTVARGRWGSWALQVMTSPSSSSLAVIHRELTVTLPSGLVYNTVNIRCEGEERTARGRTVMAQITDIQISSNHLKSVQIIISNQFKSNSCRAPTTLCPWDWVLSKTVLTSSDLTSGSWETAKQS